MSTQLDYDAVVLSFVGPLGPTLCRERMGRVHAAAPTFFRFTLELTTCRL